MTPISKGKFNNRHGVLIFILFIMMAVVSFYLFQHAFSFRNIQLDVLIAAISLSAFFLFILVVAVQDLKAVDIYEEHIRIKSPFRFYSRIINKADILLFSLTVKKNIEYIVIRTAEGDMVLPDPLINNKEELIQQLQHWRLKRKSHLEFKKKSTIETKGVGVVLIASGAFLLGFTIKSVTSPGSSVDTGKLITITGHLSMPADIKTAAGKKGSGYIQLFLTEYPGFNFLIDDIGFNTININQMRSVGKGATVELTIPKHDYAVKLLKSEEPGYFEKRYQWATINTYGVAINNENLLTIHEYNESRLALENSNKKWSVLNAVIGMLFFIYGIILYRQQEVSAPVMNEKVNVPVKSSSAK
jgi:hypothetical protein